MYIEMLFSEHLGLTHAGKKMPPLWNTPCSLTNIAETIQEAYYMIAPHQS